MYFPHNQPVFERTWIPTCTLLKCALQHVARVILVVVLACCTDSGRHPLGTSAGAMRPVRLTLQCARGESRMCNVGIKPLPAIGAHKDNFCSICSLRVAFEHGSHGLGRRCEEHAESFNVHVSCNMPRLMWSLWRAQLHAPPAPQPSCLPAIGTRGRLTSRSRPFCSHCVTTCRSNQPISILCMLASVGRLQR